MGMNNYQRIEDLCRRANEIAQRIISSDNEIRLWYVYDALSAELYQMVMWYNAYEDRNCIIKTTGENNVPHLVAADFGRVFDLYFYSIIQKNMITA